MNIAAIAGLAQIAFDLYQRFTRTPTAEVSAIEESEPQPKNWREGDELIIQAIQRIDAERNESDAALGQLADTVGRVAEAQTDLARQFIAARNLMRWAACASLVGGMCGVAALVIVLTR